MITENQSCCSTFGKKIHKSHSEKQYVIILPHFLFFYQCKYQPKTCHWYNRKQTGVGNLWRSISSWCHFKKILHLNHISITNTHTKEWFVDLYTDSFLDKNFNRRLSIFKWKSKKIKKYDINIARRTSNRSFKIITIFDNINQKFEKWTCRCIHIWYVAISEYRKIHEKKKQFWCNQNFGDLQAQLLIVEILKSLG